MKVLAIVLSALIAVPAYADPGNDGVCDFDKEINQKGDLFEYSKDCHREFGKTVKDLEDREKQVKNYKEILDIKTYIIEQESKRADMWQDTSLKLKDRMDTLESNNSTRSLLYVGLGVLLTVGAGWAIGQAAK